MRSSKLSTCIWLLLASMSYCALPVCAEEPQGGIFQRRIFKRKRTSLTPLPPYPCLPCKDPVESTVEETPSGPSLSTTLPTRSAPVQVTQPAMKMPAPRVERYQAPPTQVIIEVPPPDVIFHAVQRARVAYDPQNWERLRMAPPTPTRLPPPGSLPKQPTLTPPPPTTSQNLERLMNRMDQALGAIQKEVSRLESQVQTLVELVTEHDKVLRRHDQKLSANPKN